MKNLDSAKYIILKGYRPEFNPDNDRQIAKQPIAAWQSPENQFSYAEALEYAAQGYWVGMICPEGCIILDMDTPENVGYISKNYKNINNMQETRNGYHLVYVAPEEGISGATHNLNAGFTATFRTAGKNYIVVAPSEGYTWVSRGELQALPEELRPTVRTKKNYSKSTKRTPKKHKIISIFGDLKTVQKHIYRKYGYPTGKISLGTFDLLGRIKKAPLGKRHDTRNSVIFKFVAWAKGGCVQWAELGLILAEAVKTRNTLHPEKALSQMMSAFSAALAKVEAEEYIPARKSYDARQITISVKNLIKTKAKAAGPNAQFVVVTAAELASIAPLNCAPMQNILKQYRVRTATRNIYIFSILRKRPKGIRAMFRASLVPVLITRKPKTRKPAQPKIEALLNMYSGLSDTNEKEDWEVMADILIARMVEQVGPPIEVEPTPSPPIQPGEVGFDLVAFVRAKLSGGMGECLCATSPALKGAQ